MKILFKNQQEFEITAKKLALVSCPGIFGASEIEGCRYCFSLQCRDCWTEALKSISTIESEERNKLQEILERLEEYPHGKYTDDYGKGFSVAMNIAIEIVKEVGGMNVL